MKSDVEKLKKILEKIELTKTQRDRAIEIYTNVCKEIEKKSGLDIDFYPQGSFATKTAVRPYKNGKDQAYDVDVICEVDLQKNSVTPDMLKEHFRKALKNSRYDGLTKEYGKCFTLEFEEREGVDFSIDIIPSIPEDYMTKQELITITEKTLLIDTSIAIPDTENHSWITNNPKGYVKWFNEEIEKFHGNYLFENRNSDIRASIEELPEDTSSNMLLNIVKVLKRTRDVFYYRRGNDGKPASIIITTIVGKLAEKLRPTSNELELFRQVIEQLKQLKKYPTNRLSDKTSVSGYAISDIIIRDMGEWRMKNPANGNDNILSSWNEDESKVKEFFNWVDNLYNTFSKDLGEDEEEIRKLYNAFAIESQELLSNKVQFSVASSSTKPWRI